MTEFPTESQVAGDGETLDAILRGRVRVFQHRRGHRFGADALLLADFLDVKPSDALLDIGTGSGIISLVLCRTRAIRHVTAVEMQESLAALARRNAALNGALQGAEEKITVVCEDIRKLKPKEKFDAAFSNPPYRIVGKGRIAPDRERALARHELTLTLDELFTAARRLLAPRGKFSLVHLAERRGDVEAAAAARGFHLSRARDVLSHRGEPAVLILREYSKRRPSRAAKCMPPLVLFTKAGAHTREARKIFEGE